VVILGVGAIGSEVARLARRFGLRVIGVSRSGKSSRLVDRMVRPAALAGCVVVPVGPYRPYRPCCYYHPYR